MTLAPSPMEQDVIDRFDQGVDALLMDEIDALEPLCEWPGAEFHEADCSEHASHVTRCRVCGRLARFVCFNHAARTVTDHQTVQHAACGARRPLCELMAVRKI